MSVVEWAILGLSIFMDPLVITGGAVTGIFARRWSHTALSLLIVPSLYWLGHRLFYSTWPDHFLKLVCLILLGGIFWAVAIFAAKRQLHAS
jgi:hypothetical protein